MKRPLILGISASLRAARWKDEGMLLAEELRQITDREGLDVFISDQAKIHLDQFLEAGRKDGKPFDELYRKLRHNGGLRGLSNSEVCLAAALWGAIQNGADVEHIALSKYFLADGSERDIDELRSKLLAVDGILLATPVYFGDRSSLSQKLIELLRRDNELRIAMESKVYGGLAVGAKRNGGQETTLIYQMLDMINIGMIGVGNDSETTSQYGGTAHAGDVGTIPNDSYGINTSIGTGRRIARVTMLKILAENSDLSNPLKIGIWILQDRNGELNKILGKFVYALEPLTNNITINLVNHRIRPCIACDICPTHVGPDDEYRCIIKTKDDGLKTVHNELLDCDIIMPALYSPEDRDDLFSVYQQFMERTRYLRRGDYVFTDQLIVPFIISDINSHENLHIRVMTSFIRHHTVMFSPIIGWLHENKKILNAENITERLQHACRIGRELTIGRLSAANTEIKATQYQPVGYVLSQAKDKEAATISAREQATEKRNYLLRREAKQRLKAKRRSMPYKKYAETPF